jgi:sec-independent protein translocase protein TatB
MFDIAFTELLLIAVIALIVIGPERLPRVARTAGHLVGRMQRYVSDVKADISREMELDELKKLQSSMEDAARTFSHSVEKEVAEAGNELNQLARDADPAPDPYPDDDFPELPASQPAAGAPGRTDEPEAQREATDPAPGLPDPRGRDE